MKAMPKSEALPGAEMREMEIWAVKDTAAAMLKVPIKASGMVRDSARCSKSPSRPENAPKAAPKGLLTCSNMYRHVGRVGPEATFEARRP